MNTPSPMPLSGKILHKKADNMDSMRLPFSYNFMKKLYSAHPGLPVRIKEAHAIIIFPDTAKSHFSFGRQLLPRVSKIYHSSLE